MTRPRLLDLFCGAGGAAMGYSRAGFDVVGVDSSAKVGKHFPFEFHQADALEFLVAHGHEFSAVHGSPPCKDWTVARFGRGVGYEHGSGWLLAATRKAFIELGKPWVLENVPTAPIRPDFELCGCMFDLPGLRRRRLFEVSWPVLQMRASCYHRGQTVTVAGYGVQGREQRLGIKIPQADREAAMGIHWMNRDELAQAIPPAYTQFIGAELLEHLARSSPEALPSSDPFGPDLLTCKGKAPVGAA